MRNTEKPTFFYILKAATFQKRNIVKIGVSMNVSKRKGEFYRRMRCDATVFKTVELDRKKAFQIERKVKRQFSKYAICGTEIFDQKPQNIWRYVKGIL